MKKHWIWEEKHEELIDLLTDLMVELHGHGEVQEAKLTFDNEGEEDTVVMVCEYKEDEGYDVQFYEEDFK